VIAEPGEVGGTINIVDDAGAVQPLDLPVTVVDIEGGTNDTIVYVSFDEGARSIGSVQADAASPTPNVITDGLNDHDPTVTPDGTQLAFVRTDSDDAGNEVNTLVTTDIAGGIEYPIIASPRSGVLRAPSRSPDGGRLVVSMTATGNDSIDTEQVFVIDPAIGAIQATDGEGDKPEAIWISDGEIAYRIVTADQRNGQIFRVAAPTAG
jgi:dipeptidyl aminopeptidase/acylaminoacyl peptidase